MGDKVLGAVVTVGLLVASAGSFAAFSFLGVTKFAGAALAVGTLTAATLLLEKLGPKPGRGAEVGSQDYRQQLRSERVSARWIYGRARIGGVLCYVNDYLGSGDTTSAFVRVQSPENRKRAAYIPAGSAHKNCHWSTNPISQEQTYTCDIVTGLDQNGEETTSPATYPALLSSPSNRRDDGAGSEGLFMVLLLSEGAIDGIEKVWVAGAEMPFSLSQDVITPSADEVDTVKFKQDGKDAIRIYVHRGEASGSALLNRWGRQGALNGISAVGVELTQYEDKPWTSTPSIEFLVKGIRITWPGQTSPVWTENAAAIRWHYLTEAKGFDPAYVSEASVRSAYAVCNQDVNGKLRYSINGVVSDNEDFDSVSAAMDQAWMGSAPELNGAITFRPGATRTVSAVIQEEDLVENRDITWNVEAPIFESADALDGAISANADSGDFLAYSLERVGRTGLDAVVEDIGTMQYVAYPDVGHRLLQNHLARRNQQRRLQLPIAPGHSMSGYSLLATDWIFFNAPSENINNDKFEIEQIRYSPDGVVVLHVVEVPDNLYSFSSMVLPGFLVDSFITPALDKPTGLGATVVVSTSNTDFRDIIFSADQSPDGTDLQLRYKFANNQPWRYTGVGGSINEVRSGQTIIVSARLASGAFRSFWTEEQDGLFLLTLSTDPELPVLTVTGETAYVRGAAVDIDVEYELSGEDKSVDPATGVIVTGLPSWLQSQHVDLSGGGGGTIDPPPPPPPPESDPVVRFATAASDVGEANTSHTVSLTLNKAPGAAITVDYGVTGTASSGSDYTAPSGSVSVQATDTSSGITVGILDDTETEPAETIILKLEAGNGYTVGTPHTHTITILANTEITVPGPPTGLTLSQPSGTRGQMRASWTPPSDFGGVVSVVYEVRQQRAGSQTWATPVRVSAGTTHTFTNLFAGTSYNVQVRTVNDKHNSPWSASVTGSASNALEAPDTVTYANGYFVLGQTTDELRATFQRSTSSDMSNPTTRYGNTLTRNHFIFWRFSAGTWYIRGKYNEGINGGGRSSGWSDVRKVVVS